MYDDLDRSSPGIGALRTLEGRWVVIRWQRSIRHRHGKWSAAVQWTKEAAQYLNTLCPETQVQVFTMRFGALDTIHSIADFEDLAALDRWQKRLWSSEGYRELVIKSPNDLFIEGSVIDTVLESA